MPLLDKDSIDPDDFIPDEELGIVGDGEEDDDEEEEFEMLDDDKEEWDRLTS